MSSKVPPGAFILDTFDHSQCRSQREYWEKRRDYEWQRFGELARQRSALREDLIAALSETAITEAAFKTWYRAVSTRFAHDPLNSIGSLKKPPGGRFNIGESLAHALTPFPALYIAENRQTTFAEFFQLEDGHRVKGLAPHELAQRPRDGIAVFPIRGKLERVYDLREPKNLQPYVNVLKQVRLPARFQTIAKALGLPPTPQAVTQKDLYHSILSKEWRSWGLGLDVPSESQILGHLLASGGFQGVLYPSLRKIGSCLAVFHNNFAGTNSYIELIEPIPEGCKLSRLGD